MEFRGRTSAAIVDEYRDYLNRVLARTISERRLIAAKRTAAGRFEIAFRYSGGPSPALLQSRFGRLRLYVGQYIQFLDRLAQPPISITAYRYAITRDDDSDAVFRWESDRSDRDPMAKTSRFHFQGDISVVLSPRHPPANLNDIHLPTGWVPIEEVIRFCIVDLGVEPLSDDWDARLRQSIRMTRALESR